MKRCIIIILFFMFIAKSTAADLVPFQGRLYKGVWIYQGTVKWQDNRSAKVNKRLFTWRSEVKDVITIFGDSVAEVNGFPADLAWYESGRESQKYIFVMDTISGNLSIYLNKKHYTLAQINLRPDLLFTEIKDNCAYAFDLGAASNKNNNIVDQWVIKKRHSRVNINIDSIPESARWTVYTITFRTNSDYEQVEYVPRIGIISYKYHHFGTSSDVDLKLVQIIHQ